MDDPDAPPPPILDKGGVWRDPMALEAMTPKQRARYVRMLREDSNTMGPRGDLQRAREQAEAFIAKVANSEGGQPGPDPDPAK